MPPWANGRPPRIRLGERGFRSIQKQSSKWLTESWTAVPNVLSRAVTLRGRSGHRFAHRLVRLRMRMAATYPATPRLGAPILSGRAMVPVVAGGFRLADIRASETPAVARANGRPTRIRLGVREGSGTSGSSLPRLTERWFRSWPAVFDLPPSGQVKPGRLPGCTSSRGAFVSDDPATIRAGDAVEWRRAKRPRSGWGSTNCPGRAPVQMEAARSPPLGGRVSGS